MGILNLYIRFEILTVMSIKIECSVRGHSVVR